MPRELARMKGTRVRTDSGDPIWNVVERGHVFLSLIPDWTVVSRCSTPSIPRACVPELVVPFSAPVFRFRNRVVSGFTSPGAFPNVPFALRWDFPKCKGLTEPGCALRCMGGLDSVTSGGGIKSYMDSPDCIACGRECHAREGSRGKHARMTRGAL